jgi:phosphoserine phosphatase
VGDGANDLLMLDRAALGVAFCAKPVVRRHADVAIDRPDLSGVLALVGLRG